jgi:hypothetical protein
VTQANRFLLVIGVILAASLVAFYFVSRQIRYAMVQRPYVASVKLELRRVVAAQERYRQDSLKYATDVTKVWTPTTATVGVRLRIVVASADGFRAEGRHDSWSGYCVVAVGRSAGDSLPPGEPVCHGGR